MASFGAMSVSLSVNYTRPISVPSFVFRRRLAADGVAVRNGSLRYKRLQQLPVAVANGYRNLPCKKNAEHQVLG